MQQTLPYLRIPSTEGIKYIGSKLKLIPQVLELVKKVNAKTILDGFAGTTRVSQALAKLGYTVICNDVAPWSKVFGTCYLLNTKPKEAYQPLIDHLNAVPPIDGWFTEHYGGHANGGNAIQADGLKKPWQLPQYPQIGCHSPRNRNPQSRSSRKSRCTHKSNSGT